MFQGQCVFSGLMIKKGSGITKVFNDNKVQLTKGRRERTLLADKISPRSIKWTESSRAFFKKSHKSSKEKETFVPITKIVRGFSMIPAALVSKEVSEPKPHGAKKEASMAFNKDKKFLKNSNLNNVNKRN